MKVNVIEKIEDFNTAVAGGKPAIFKFGAEWCAPCKMMGNMLHQLPEDDGIEMYSVDVDSDAGVELSEKYNIMSVPVCFGFKNGEMCEKLIGAVSKENFNNFIENVKKC